MYLNLHMIQNFPASNLNRDDTGSPKDCIFGGFRRARISSQCQKRSIRTHERFIENVKERAGDLGIRTKRITDTLQRRFERAGKTPEDALRLTDAILSALGLKKDDKKNTKTEYLLYLGRKEIEELVAEALEGADGFLASKESTFDKETVKTIKSIVDGRRKKGAFAADIALFGRMIADAKEMNVDAASQVAHAFSIHKTGVETDFYTAVDDLLPQEESGAGMMGIIEFNSACYYRYANIDLNKLSENLAHNEDLLSATLKGFLEASVYAVPTGMQNSFAAQTLPAYILITLEEAPASLANAFIKPVKPRENESIEKLGIETLKEYDRRRREFYSTQPHWSREIDFYGEGHVDELIEETLKAIEKPENNGETKDV